MELDARLEPVLRAAAPLTEYAWKFRYPGEPEEPAPEQAAAAIELAQGLVQAVSERLPLEARPPAG